MQFVVKEHYKTGKIDNAKMRDVCLYNDSVKII